MKFPEDVVVLLQDEAYLALCRQTLEAAHQEILNRRKEVETTRPPFGVLATKRTREAFEHSMRTVHDTEAGVQSRLATIAMLSGSIQPVLRGRLQDLMQASSAEYRMAEELCLHVDAWERRLPPYLEQLRAFARELRNLHTRLEGAAAAGQTQIFSIRIQAIAELRITTETMDAAGAELETCTVQLMQAVGESRYQENLTLPSPPYVRTLSWIDGLSRLGDAEVVNAARLLEIQVREYIADQLSVYHQAAATARDTIRLHRSNLLEIYWQQLRLHAQAHYVKERDVDEVIDELYRRHVESALQKRQQALASARSVYIGER